MAGASSDAPRVAVVRLGCRVNQADADAALQALAARTADSDGAGAAPAHGAAGAGSDGLHHRSRPDAVVVSTCAVTADAEAAAFQAVRRASREHPGVPVVVCGCLGALRRRELAAIDGVAAVVGPGAPQAVADAVAAAIPPGVPRRRQGRALRGGSSRRSAPPAPAGGDGASAAEDWGVAPRALAGRARPILKIQDGCDQRCAYCIVPFARGPSRSMPRDAALERIAALGRIADEVVLAGVHLGAFGVADAGVRSGPAPGPARSPLAALLDAVAERRLVRRVRLSSVDPLEFPLDALTGSAATALCPSFHLPIQSGSDRILQAMKRPYTAEQAAATVRRIAAAMPGASVTADVITGFPGETEDDHRATVALVRALPLAALHVFAFSPREGTVAAAMPGRVPREVMRRRAEELRAVSSDAWRAFVERQPGRDVEAVTERVVGAEARGTTREGVLARWTVERDAVPRRGRAVLLRAVSREGDGLRCERPSQAC